MAYRWKCSTCQNFFYTLVCPPGATSYNVPPEQCPMGKFGGCKADYNMEVTAQTAGTKVRLDSVAVSRERRSTAMNVNYNESVPMSDDNHDTSAPMSDDGHDTSESMSDDGDDDPEYLPSKEGFSIAMRYTDDARETFTGVPKGQLPHTKKMKTFAITAAKARTSQQAVMNKVLKKPKTAWQLAGRPSYKKNKKKSSEWCHLQGASLGGPTVDENLISASFAANSIMCVMEMALAGKTDLRVTVTPYVISIDGDQQHVAECIRYLISAKDSKKPFDEWIDARGDGFLKQDADKLRESLEGWVKKNSSIK